MSNEKCGTKWFPNISPNGYVVLFSAELYLNRELIRTFELVPHIRHSSEIVISQAAYLPSADLTASSVNIISLLKVDNVWIQVLI